MVNVDNKALYRELKEIKSMLRKTSKVCNWVNGQVLTQITVWDNRDKLHTARKNGYVEYKRDGKSVVYNLDSIHNIFFKQQNHTQNETNSL